LKIITLLTDFGWQDAYVAQLKALMLTSGIHIESVDISHTIPQQNIKAAAHVLSDAWHHFPKGTIHTVGVASGGSELDRHLVIAHEGHYFIGADNGIFSLIFGPNPQQAFQLNTNYTGSNPMRGLYIPTAIKIAAGEPIESLGMAMISIKDLGLLDAYTTANEIRGSIVHIDFTGNAITNIHKSIFEPMAATSSYRIEVRDAKQILRSISIDYYQVQSGNRLALFNEEGYLEIAMNSTSAEKLLGCKVDDAVQITFEDL